MIIAIGLVVLAAAFVIAIAGVLHNRGPSHSLNHSFTVLGQHISGSSGTLFLYGIILGAVGLAGLLLLLGGVRRSARRSRQARSELKEARQTAAAIAQDRDQVAHDRDQLAQAQRRMPPPTTAPAPAAPPTHSEVPADANQHAFFAPMPSAPDGPAHRAQ